MLWNMIVEAQTEEQLTASITVQAPNWYGALREGLEKHHIDGAVLSTLSCRVQTDRSVIASDVVSNRVFVLRPVETVAAGEKESASADDGPERVTDAPPVAHELFLMRDRMPADEQGVCYRERHIAVGGDISKQDASHLVYHYFELLKAEGAPDGCKCFISVHLYDHVFAERSERPPIAALTWREWMSEKPKLLYPLSGDEGTTFSMLPAPAEPILLVPQSAPASAAKGSGDKEKKRATAERFGVGERMIAAFEGMQDIYGIHKHDEAAAFVLSLARDLVRCEGGSCMLISPKEYVLYVAAAEGAVATPYLKKTVSSQSGTIGFALKNSAVINVSDPEGDARFDGSDDGREGFSPRSVLCAPMQYEGQVIGVLELVNSPRADGFIDEEVNVLSYLGTSFAEYAALSLPSRQAEFTDRDFADIPAVVPSKRPSVNPAAKASAPSAAEKASETGTPPNVNAPETKKRARAAATKAEEKNLAAQAAGKSSGKKRSGKKKKRR